MSASAVEVGPAGIDRRREATAAESVVSWGGAIALLVLMVWLVPIKNYRLPIHLPFSLEVYRLLIIIYIVALDRGRGERHAPHRRPAGSANRSRCSSP